MHGRMQDLPKGGATFYLSLGELRDAKRHHALVRGVRGHAPPRNIFIWSNLVRFGVYFDKILI